MHGTDQIDDFGRNGLAAPFRQVDALNLAETERRQRAVDRHWDQPFAIAPPRGLIAHPVRLHRLRRPENDDCIGLFECRFRGLGKGRPTAQQTVPPNVKPGALQRLDHKRCAREVGPRIAQEYRNRLGAFGRAGINRPHVVAVCPQARALLFAMCTIIAPNNRTSLAV
jgi:hypothetical protein